MCRTCLNREFESKLIHFLDYPSRVRVELFFRRDPTSWEQVLGLGELGVTRWLEKPPIPSAVYAQEPKMRVVPSGTLLASLDPAIEFVGELAESPTWRASCRCLPPNLLRDTLSSRIVGKDRLALELDGARNTRI